MSPVSTVLILLFSSNLNVVRSEKIGELAGRQHGVSGTVITFNDRKTVSILGFSYDGRGSDAFFYFGTDTASPNPDGTMVPYPPGSSNPLGSFNRDNVTLTLPEDVHTSDLRWLAVWSRKNSMNYGEVIFPHHLMYIDDGDNNSNNGGGTDVADVDDDDEDFPETPDDHLFSSSGRKWSIPSQLPALVATCLILSKKILASV